jgi:hypothetical protein
VVAGVGCSPSNDRTVFDGGLCSLCSEGGRGGEVGGVGVDGMVAGSERTGRMVVVGYLSQAAWLPEVVQVVLLAGSWMAVTVAAIKMVELKRRRRERRKLDSSSSSLKSSALHHHLAAFLVHLAGEVYDSDDILVTGCCSGGSSGGERDCLGVSCDC